MTATILDPGPDDAALLRDLGWTENDIADHLGYDESPPDEPESDQAQRPGRIPEEFWKARPVFQHIRQAAHSHACSGDVLFYSALARMSGMVSHNVRARTGIGGAASLNIFAAIVGASGTGKSTGSSLSRDLMPCTDEDFRDGLPIGSGEGIAEVFMGTAEEDSGQVITRGKNVGEAIMKRVRKQVRHNAYFYVDEGQTLTQLGERSNSVLNETLRRAAVGETLGQTNASEDRTRYIPAGSYSLGLVVGFQPSTAVPVLADAATGTPQRFLWGWADDPSIPDTPTAWPGPIESHPGNWRPGSQVTMEFPEDIKAMLWRERVQRNRGEIEVSALDGHAGLIKVKLAALFALLDGRRSEVSGEDWELAELIWGASCQTRDALVLRAERERFAEQQRDEQARVEREVRAHEAKKGSDLALDRVARLVKKHASRLGGISHGALTKALASRDRDLMDKAVALAVAREWVFEEGDRVCVTTG